MGTRKRIKVSAEKVYAVSGRECVYRTDSARMTRKATERRRMTRKVATGLMVAILWGMADRPVEATPNEVEQHKSVQNMFKPQYV